MNHEPANHLKGLFALALLALLYGLTGILARYLTTDLGIFEQWYIRFLVALVVAMAVFRRHISFSKFRHLSSRESAVMTARSLLGFVVAMWLYAASTHYATIGSVAAMQIVPMTALFGVVIFREKVSKTTLGLILLSFAGAAIVALQNVAHVQFGVGELMSLASGALFSLSLVLRKKQTGELNNYELVVGVTLVACIGNYLMNVATGGAWWPHFGGLRPAVLVLLVVAGVLSTFMSLLANYGFEHVKATTASIILNLEIVFGIIFGYLFYREVLTLRQAIGALVILLASSAVAYLEAKKTTPAIEAHEPAEIV